MDNFSFATAVQEKVKSGETKVSSGIICPHCGAQVPADCEICPSCGKRLVGYCTFCGAEMEWSDSECPECGAPADGIRCPSCGATSHRSFCPQCNTPVTKAAIRLVQSAKNDPLYRDAAAQAEQVGILEQKLEECPPSEAPRIRQELIKVTNDLNGILERMLPPAGSTPQEQRNYYSARKVAVTVRTTRLIRLGWVCNYCGYTHDQPSECCKPYLGGKWKYEEVTTTSTDYVKE